MTDTKDTNPKDALGLKRPPLSTLPCPVLFEVGAAMLEGACKYRRHNYRAVGVRASVYYDAAMRHLMQWWEGQDVDDDSGISHISKAIAGLVILRDSMMQGNLNDDRPPSAYEDWMEDAKETVSDVLERFPNPLPPYRQDEEMRAIVDQLTRDEDEDTAECLDRMEADEEPSDDRVKDRRVNKGYEPPFTRPDGTISTDGDRKGVFTQRRTRTSGTKADRAIATEDRFAHRLKPMDDDRAIQRRTRNLPFVVGKGYQRSTGWAHVTARTWIERRKKNGTKRDRAIRCNFDKSVEDCKARFDNGPFFITKKDCDFAEPRSGKERRSYPALMPPYTRDNGRVEHIGDRHDHHGETHEPMSHAEDRRQFEGTVADRKGEQ